MMGAPLLPELVALVDGEEADDYGEDTEGYVDWVIVRWSDDGGGGRSKSRDER